MLEALLRKLFGYPKHYKITKVNFAISKAMSGKVLRECVTIYGVNQAPPHTEDNWHSKLCAVVFFGKKILDFKVTRV